MGMEVLGEGSFGVVFKAVCIEDNSAHAIKISKEASAHQDKAEVEKLQLVPPHPNCIKFYRAWEENQKLYIQTELCEMR